MDFDRLNNDRKALQRRNRGLALTVGALAAGHLLTLTTLLSVLGSERTVLVPPTLNKSFWVTDAKASGSYLEQMASFIAWLVLDVSPGTIAWKRDMLLAYVEPAQHGVLQARQDVEAERLKRINAATTFALEQLVPSEAGQSVVLRGRLRTLVNSLETSNEARAYLVEFGFAGARMHLKTFKEVPYGNS